MLSELALTMISCIIYIIFAIVKSIELNTYTASSPIITRGKAVFEFTFLNYKLLVKTLMHVFILFISFTIVFAFLDMLIGLVTGKLESSALFMNVLRIMEITVNLFLGMFNRASTFFYLIILMPIFALFFMSHWSKINVIGY